jgi:hypothetical protein
MKVQLDQQQPIGLFSSLFAPLINVCVVAKNLTNACVVVSEIINEGAILTKDISLTALEQQKEELLARRNMLAIN